MTNVTPFDTVLENLSTVLGESLSDFQYVGFNRGLYQNAVKRVLGSWENVAKMILFILQRGSITPNKKGTKAEVINMLTGWLNRIKSEPNCSGFRSSTIMVLWPDLTCKLRLKLEKVIHPWDAGTTLPVQFRWLGAGSAIPATMSEEFAAYVEKAFTVITTKNDPEQNAKILQTQLGDMYLDPDRRLEISKWVQRSSDIIVPIGQSGVSESYVGVSDMKAKSEGAPKSRK